MVIRKLFFNSYLFTYTFVDKTIKLWKVYERSLKTVSESSMMTDSPSVVGNFGSPFQNSFSIPKINHQDSIVAAIPRRIYSNGKRKKGKIRRVNI